MPVGFLLKNAKLLADGLDLSANANEVNMQYGSDALEETTFADVADGGGTHIFQAGLLKGSVDYKGFWKAVPDTLAHAKVGVVDAPLSIGPTGADGDPMFFLKALRGTLARTANIGTLLGIAGHFDSRGAPILLGTVMARGVIGAGVANQFLASTNMKATAYTMTSTTLPAGYSARRVTITHTAVTGADTLGSAALVGTDENGAAQSESLALVSGGVATSLKAYKTLTGCTTASWVISGGNDTIVVGFADVGVARNLGAVSATQKLYAILHVLDIPAGTLPTLDVLVNSAATQAGSMTTRLTFAQQIAQGGVYAVPVAGPFTDTWWAVGFTVGGTASPSFKVSASVAIL